MKCQLKTRISSSEVISAVLCLSLFEQKFKNALVMKNKRYVNSDLVYLNFKRDVRVLLGLLQKDKSACLHSKLTVWQEYRDYFT